MRRPLPLFSASEPSGLKIRSAARAPPGGEGLTSSKIPSAPIPKCRSQIRRTRSGSGGIPSASPASTT